MEIKRKDGFTDIVYKMSETRRYQYVTVLFKIPGDSGKNVIDVSPESIDRIISPLLKLGAEITLTPRYFADVWAIPGGETEGNPGGEEEKEED